jgi:queuine/archaeosine tRNA-ribosyltransferase
MGDCGAFDYIEQDEPPYSTADVIEYYTRLDFDYGVSVDHLVVPAFELQKHRRYELTIHNAEEFLREHRKLGLKWEPIGAVQGWDIKRYVEAARKYVAMGYRYIALGGLVRSQTSEILTTVQAVRDVIPADVQIHVFGFSRFDAVQNLIQAGANSIDSASMLRKAWLGANLNYLTPTGWYSAIRIPQAGGSFRAKRLVQDGKASLEQLKRLEQECLQTLRAFASGRAEPSEILVNHLVEYDTLVAGERAGTAQRLRRTLEDRPWEHCDCAICRRWGVEVVIFRGNNRNRRRGFHNTYVFYRLMQDMANGTRGSLDGELHPQMELPIDKVAVGA